MFNAYSIAKPNIEFISYTTIVSSEAAPTEVESIEKAKVGFLRCGITFVTQTDVWLSTGGVRDAVCLLPYKVHDLWTRTVSEEHWKTSADPRQMLDGVAVCGSTSNVCLPDPASVLKSADLHKVLDEVVLSRSTPHTCRLSNQVSVPRIADQQQISNMLTCMSLLNSHHLQFLTRKLWFRV